MFLVYPISHKAASVYFICLRASFPFYAPLTNVQPFVLGGLKQLPDHLLFVLVLDLLIVQLLRLEPLAKAGRGALAEPENTL
jgi:hypothetical protein